MLNEDYVTIFASKPAHCFALYSLFDWIAYVPVKNVVLVPDVDD